VDTKTNTGHDTGHEDEP